MEVRANSIQRLLEQRNQIVAQIEALQNKVGGLDIAIAILSEEPDEVETRPGVPAPDEARVFEADEPRARVTEAILDLLRRSGSEGINAKIAVRQAAESGLTLNRSSVSSLLSRLKRDGTVVYENARYQLREPPRSAIRVMPGGAVAPRMAANASS